jgi:hypothetical protein
MLASRVPVSADSHADAVYELRTLRRRSTNGAGAADNDPAEREAAADATPDADATADADPADPDPIVDAIAVGVDATQATEAQFASLQFAPAQLGSLQFASQRPDSDKLVAPRADAAAAGSGAMVAVFSIFCSSADLPARFR